MACGAERLAGGHGCPSVERIGPASMTLLAIGLSSTSSQRLSDSPRCPHISGETPVVCLLFGNQSGSFIVTDIALLANNFYQNP